MCLVQRIELSQTFGVWISPFLSWPPVRRPTWLGASGCLSVKRPNSPPSWGASTCPGRKDQQMFINPSLMWQLKQLTEQSPKGSQIPAGASSFHCPPPVLHPNWAGQPPASGQAPGLFPGGEFPLALWGSPRRMHEAAAGNEEHIFKSEGEALSLCQMSGLDPGLRGGGASPLADSRCSPRCGYGNKINDG